MCDTLCIVRDGRMLFAKNSDRPPDEVQLVEAFARRPASDAPLRTQYLDLGADPGGFAFVASRPTWLWGVEHGLNEHGVAVGNEKVWTTDDPRGKPAALLGMDVVRLALERATSAEHGVDVITSLVEQYGQGGSGEQDADEPYHSSFLVADPHAAWVVETSDRTWAARRAGDGCAAISNRLSLGADWDRASGDVTPGTDFQLRRAPAIPTGIADHRLVATRAAIAQCDSPADLASWLRHHGTRPWGRPDAGDPLDVEPIPTDVGDDFAGVTVCMHVRGYQNTTASMIAEVHADGRPMRLWCALGNPCVSTYRPFVFPAVPAELTSGAEWTAAARRRDDAEGDPEALARIRAGLARPERELWSRS